MPKVTGPKFTSVPITLHTDRTIEELVAAGNYEYFNPLINSQSFNTATFNWFVTTQLICFGKPMANELLPRQWSQHGVVPRGMVDLLTLRVQYPELDLTDPIVAPAAVLTKDGQRYIGCLFNFAGEPNIGVIWERQCWSARYRFLVD